MEHMERQLGSRSFVSRNVMLRNEKNRLPIENALQKRSEQQILIRTSEAFEQRREKQLRDFARKYIEHIANKQIKALERLENTENTDPDRVWLLPEWVEKRRNELFELWKQRQEAAAKERVRLWILRQREAAKDRERLSILRDLAAPAAEKSKEGNKGKEKGRKQEGDKGKKIGRKGKGEALIRPAFAATTPAGVVKPPPPKRLVWPKPPAKPAAEPPAPDTVVLGKSQPLRAEAPEFTPMLLTAPLAPAADLAAPAAKPAAPDSAAEPARAVVLGRSPLLRAEAAEFTPTPLTAALAPAADLAAPAAEPAAPDSVKFLGGPGCLENEPDFDWCDEAQYAPQYLPEWLDEEPEAAGLDEEPEAAWLDEEPEAAWLDEEAAWLQQGFVYVAEYTRSTDREGDARNMSVARAF